MNVNAALGLLLIVIVILVLAVYINWGNGITGLVSTFFWLYIIFFGLYFLYLLYLQYNDMDFENNAVNVAIHGAGSYIRNVTPRVVVNEGEGIIKPSSTGNDTVAVYRMAYVLGFPLEWGEPDMQWCNEQKRLIDTVGEQKYYTQLYNENKERIQKSASSKKFVIHSENTLGESVYKYSTFDLVENYTGGHLYMYTRDEWKWIEDHKQCPWTRKNIPNAVLTTIRSRSIINTMLGNVFIYPISNENDNIGNASQSSQSSQSQMSMSYLDNQIEGEAH
jgi:hypothetical protein